MRKEARNARAVCVQVKSALLLSDIAILVVDVVREGNINVLHWERNGS